MAQLFRFRVREGEEIFEFNEDTNRATKHGAGFELVLNEQEAARLLRRRNSRTVFDLVEVVELASHSLTAFPLDSDRLVGEWRLEGVSLSELQAMFDRPADDPMGNEYRVLPHHVERIERAIGQSLDLARFEYFVGPAESD